MTHEPNRTRNASDGPLPQAEPAGEPAQNPALIDRILSGRDLYYSATDHPFETDHGSTDNGSTAC